jgi:26S proteasome regulatory subunit T1
VVGLGEKVAPTDIEESMRVGVDRTKYFIQALTAAHTQWRPLSFTLRCTALQIPLPPRIDPSVTMMTVEDKPDVTYDDVGGAGEALEKLREVRRRSHCAT